MTTFCLKVWGDHACFSRPELKVERVSYDVMTPSAARAIFEAVFWKPAIRWEVQKIEVCHPIQYDTIRRNEVGSKIPANGVKTAMQDGRKRSGALAMYVEEDRQQRAAVVLRRVAYRLHARMVVRPECLEPGESPAKYLAMFERRAKAGQCFTQPYLGCREFTAHWAWCDPATEPYEPPDGLKDQKQPLNWMLYDLDYGGPEPQPLFFNPVLDNGVVWVPAPGSPEVKR